MLVSDAISRIRAEVHDTSSIMFTDAQIIALLDEYQNKVIQQNDITKTFINFTYPANTFGYVINPNNNPNILGVRSVLFWWGANTVGQPLERVTFEEALLYNKVPTTSPVGYYIQSQANVRTIYLCPTPSVPVDISLIYVAGVTPLTSQSQAFTIDDVYVDSIIKSVSWRLLRQIKDYDQSIAYEQGMPDMTYPNNPIIVNGKKK